MKLKECQYAKVTDKGNQYHSYRGTSFLDLYDNYFANRRLDHLNVLEIGVSLHHFEGQEIGSSLWLWEEYFPNSQIFGIDIDPMCKIYERERVHIEIGNQAKADDLQKIIDRAGHFDIIIDDGSHVNQYILASFNTLFPHLREGGFYVIEDLGCSYGKLEDWGARESWPGMSYNDSRSLNNDRSDMDEFFRHIILQLDTCSADCKSVHFWSQICFILK